MPNACEETILAYLVQTNRPYCINDVAQRFHAEYNKPTVTRAIETLVSNGSVKEKAYNKQKVYFVNQDRYANVNEDQMQALEKRANELLLEREKLETQASMKQSLLNNFTSFASAEDTYKEIDAVEQEIISLEKRLAECKNQSTDLSEFNKVKEEYKKLKASFQKRRRIAREAFDMILDNYNGKRDDQKQAGNGTGTDQSR